MYIVCSFILQFQIFFKFFEGHLIELGCFSFGSVSLLCFSLSRIISVCPFSLFLLFFTFFQTFILKIYFFSFIFLKKLTVLFIHSCATCEYSFISEMILIIFSCLLLFVVSVLGFFFLNRQDLGKFL